MHKISREKAGKLIERSNNLPALSLYNPYDDYDFEHAIAASWIRDGGYLDAAGVLIDMHYADGIIQYVCLNDQ